MPDLPDKKELARIAELRRSYWQQYKMEATGILIIGALITAIALVRYWHNISWSLR